MEDFDNSDGIKNFHTNDFDNSHTKQNLGKKFNGGVHSDKYNPSFYVYEGSSPYHLRDNKVNFGIKSSDKYNIPLPQFPSHKPVNYPNSNFSAIPTQGRLDFKGADMDKFFSVHNKTLDLNNYAGSAQHAKGIHTEEQFTVSQARKEADGNDTVYHTDPEHIFQFMNRPQISRLVGYEAKSNYTMDEQQRQDAHRDSREKRIKRSMAPAINPAFGANIDQPKETDDLSNDLKERLQQRVEELEASHSRIAKKIAAKKREKSTNTAIEKIHQSNEQDMMGKEEAERVENKRKEKIEKEEELKLNKEHQSTIKDKLKRLLQQERLEKKNADKSDKSEKSEKEESKSEKEEEGDDIMSLGDDFSKDEKNVFREFILNNRINMNQEVHKIRRQINKYLTRIGHTAIDARLRLYDTQTKWLKQLIYLIRLDPPIPEDIQRNKSPNKGNNIKRIMKVFNSTSGNRGQTFFPSPDSSSSAGGGSEQYEPKTPLKPLGPQI